MTLLQTLRRLLGSARSFQLMGEDAWLLSGAALREAARAYEEELARSVPAAQRADFEREQSDILRNAHAWLRRYNRNIHGRIRGYLALGRAAHFEYPWPIVAVLGISQVLEGVHRTRIYGLLGRALRLAGYNALEEVAGGIGDVLLRTNRGIFADSVPTVLYALRCHELRGAGSAPLAEALLAGPVPPLMDEESRSLARALYDGLVEPDGARRFARLAALTHEHFAREQAIFTHHMGPPPKAQRGLAARLGKVTEVVAPVVTKGRVSFRAYPLPRGFAMADHEARVRELGRAFVSSVTGSLAEYRAAVDYALDRFGRRGEQAAAEFGSGGTPPPSWPQHMR